MDSPLLPTFKRNPDVSGSPAGLMSNMSLEPMSPSESFAISHHASSGPSRSAYAASSGSSTTDGMDARGERPEAPGRRAPPRFSLFAPGASARAEDEEVDDQDEQRRDEEEGEVEGEGEGDETINPAMHRQDPGARDDKLRESLYELRQMNEVFEGFLTALESARGHNERLALRVKETTRLLDTYTEILVQQEHTQALLLNPNWHGALEESKMVERQEEERLAAEQAAWQAAEEARLHEEERLAEEEARREQAQLEAQAKSKESAPTRGIARGRGGTRSLSRGGGSSIPSSRTGTTTGIRKPSAGLGGQYANVKSSGYGPPAKKST